MRHLGTNGMTGEFGCVLHGDFLPVTCPQQPVTGVLTIAPAHGMRRANSLTPLISRGHSVVNAELGTKRTCPSCAARFYDLLKDPITCPKCGTAFISQPILPSKGEFPGAAPVPVAKPREKEVVEDAETGDVELISLEEVEEDGKDDDETAGIEDVDLGEEAADDAEEEDDTFLVEEEEEGGAIDVLIEGGGKEDEEET